MALQRKSGNGIELSTNTPHPRGRVEPESQPAVTSLSGESMLAGTLVQAVHFAPHKLGELFGRGPGRDRREARTVTGDQHLLIFGEST